MKLSKVQIREFKSIWDSNPIEINRVACMVGKNEAGKTALLQALYHLNPIVESDGDFDVTDDYPRSDVENYQQDVESGKRQPAVVVEATFELEESEIDAIAREYGSGVLARKEVVVSKGYAKDDSGTCRRIIDVPVDEPILVRNLVQNYELPESLICVA